MTSFFPESLLPVRRAEPAASRTMSIYFAGSLYIFWPGLTGFRGLRHEIFTGLYFFSLSFVPRRRTAPAALQPSHNFFV